MEIASTIDPTGISSTVAAYAWDLCTVTANMPTPAQTNAAGGR